MIDTRPWVGLRLIERADGGNRAEVWRGALDSLPVAVRRSLRPPSSLAWELDLMADLERHGFLVPQVVPADNGLRAVDGVVVQRWLGGRPPRSDDDRLLVAAELRRLHQTLVGYRQRPGCCTIGQLRVERRSVDVDLDALPGRVADQILAVFDEIAALGPTLSVVHGDPGSPNVRIGHDGSVALLDWDESRVDATWHDLSNLGVQVLDDEDHRLARRLSDAWEAANGWLLEPEYARRRLARLMAPDGG